MLEASSLSFKHRILTNIRRRYSKNNGGHRFICGSLELLEEILQPATPASIDVEFIAVQPGLRKVGMSTEISSILAAASDHLVKVGFNHFMSFPPNPEC